MRSWWHKAAAGFVAALLLGCTTPPGQVGNSANSVPSTTPVSRRGAGAMLAEDRAESKPQTTATPALSLGPSGAVTSATDPRLQAESEPEPTDAPLAADGPWAQRGWASWYGKQFNGRRTASGERFNAMAMTAAHRTLPLLSYARVRVVGSAKEVVVRINDRGPFHKRRVLDLSYAAARQLGIVVRGGAMVEIAPVAAQDVPGTVELGSGIPPLVP